MYERIEFYGWFAKLFALLSLSFIGFAYIAMKFWAQPYSCGSFIFLSIINGLMAWISYQSIKERSAL
jgi:hypothetical protein